MSAPINLSMFQCMLQSEDSLPELKTVWSKLKQNNDKHISSMHASPPGSLRRRLSTSEIQTHQIGSIGIKLVFNKINLSVLLFNNNKIKISGGLQKLELDMDTDLFWSFLEATLFVPCMRIVFDKTVAFEMISGMVNANIRQNLNLPFSSYLKILDQFKTDTNHVVRLPRCLTETAPRGRTCAVKLQRVDGKGSLHFDHSGNIQAFAYRNMDHLTNDVHKVVQLTRIV